MFGTRPYGGHQDAGPNIELWDFRQVVILSSQDRFVARWVAWILPRFCVYDHQRGSSQQGIQEFYFYLFIGIDPIHVFAIPHLRIFEATVIP